MPLSIIFFSVNFFFFLLDVIQEMNTTVLIKFLQAPTWLQGKTLYFEFPGRKKK